MAMSSRFLRSAGIAKRLNVTRVGSLVCVVRTRRVGHFSKRRAARGCVQRALRLCLRRILCGAAITALLVAHLHLAFCGLRRVVTLTVTMSARSSRHLSRFSALSTISSLRGGRDLVQPFLPALAASAPFALKSLGGSPRQNPREGVAKPAQAVPMLALVADAPGRARPVDGQREPVSALAADHVAAVRYRLGTRFHWKA